MLAKSFFAYLHFVAAFGLVAALFFEWFTFSKRLTLLEARRIAYADRWYGLFAMMLLMVGFTRAYAYEKGFAFYLASPFFHLKITLFVLIGLLSIYPTIRFARWAPDIRAGREPIVTDAQHTIISRCLSIQLVAMVVLLLAASLMANGVGH
jgi:putative membrane protein